MPVTTCERCGRVYDSRHARYDAQRYGCVRCGCRHVKIISRHEAEQLAYRQAFERMLAERGGECDLSEKIDLRSPGCGGSWGDAPDTCAMEGSETDVCGRL